MRDLFDRIHENKGPLGKWASQAEGYFVFPKLEGELGPRMKFQGKDILNWSLNDYLGLAKNQSLANQIEADFNLLKPNFQAINGSTGSRLISGHSRLFEQFEKKCAVFHQSEASLLFSGGYDANVGLLSSITQQGQVVFCDQLLHASLIDGLRLSKAERKIFAHNDLADLENLLREYPLETPKWIVVESVYSMDGDMAPLLELVHLKNKYQNHLI